MREAGKRCGLKDSAALNLKRRISAVHTSSDYLIFHHRFLHALREAKLISPGKLAELRSRKYSGFHIDDGGLTALIDVINYFRCHRPLRVCYGSLRKHLLALHLRTTNSLTWKLEQAMAGGCMHR